MEDLLLVGLGIGALLVRVGLGFYIAGVSRSKNSAAALMRTLCDFCFSLLAFWAVGAAILWQVNSPVLGLSGRWLLGSSAGAPFFFLCTAILTATGAVVGATAERSRFWVTCWASILLAGLIIPMAGNWAWYGWLNRMGFTDVAGASALHVAAAVCAAVGAIVIGPRAGKYNRDGSSNMVLGHSVPMMSAGALIMLAGWVAYICGSALRRSVEVDSSATNAILAAAAGGGASLIAGQVRYGKPDISFTLIGMLGALVAISAPAGLVDARWAVFIGAAAGVLVPFAAVTLDLRVRLDDPGGLVAAQFVGGVWGTLCAATAETHSNMSYLRHLGVQLLGLLAIICFSALVSSALFLALKAAGKLRPREADEFDGMDLAEHDIGAYPDFQQNMIKSYHLRET